MRDRIKLEDATRIQDIALLDTNREIENILIEIYSPYGNNLINLREINKLSPTTLSALEDRLKVLANDISKLYIFLILWLYYKNKGIHFLKEALQVLTNYFKDFNIDRESSQALFTYRFLNNVFHYIPLFLKPEELASFEDFKTFLSVYESSAERFINETFKDKTILRQPNAPFWFLKPLFSYYCSRKLADLDKSSFKNLLVQLLDKYIEINDLHWMSSVVDEIGNSCFTKEEYIPVKKKVAECYFNEGSKLQGLEAIHYLRYAAKVYTQLEDKTKLDETLSIMKEKEKTISFQTSEVTIIPELKELHAARTAKVKIHLEQAYKETSCQGLLKYLFNNYLLPDKDSTEKQAENVPLAYSIATVAPMTEGRSGVIEDQEKAKEHWKAYVLHMSLLIYHLPEIMNLYDWFLDKYGKEGFKECLLNTYKESVVYEEARLFLIDNIVDKYLSSDFIGFIYSSIPQLEHLLKLFLQGIGISIVERDIKMIEEINLNTLLVNYKEYVVNLFGENFYQILWLCFIYEYGLNIRNALSHGEGLTYLKRKYASIVFFIFNSIVLRARQVLEMDTPNDDNVTEE
jgi:hypothetical protein